MAISRNVREKRTSVARALRLLKLCLLRTDPAGVTETTFRKHQIIELTVNGNPIELSGCPTLLDAALEAGVHVPALCYYPRLPSQAVWCLWLVDVKGEAHPQPACVTKANEGDIVATDSLELQALPKWTSNSLWRGILTIACDVSQRILRIAELRQRLFVGE